MIWERCKRYHRYHILVFILLFILSCGNHDKDEKYNYCSIFDSELCIRDRNLLWSRPVKSRSTLYMNEKIYGISIEEGEGLIKIDPVTGMTISVLTKEPYNNLSSNGVDTLFLASPLIAIDSNTEEVIWSNE